MGCDWGICWNNAWGSEVYVKRIFLVAIVSSLATLASAAPALAGAPLGAAVSANSSPGTLAKSSYQALQGNLYQSTYLLYQGDGTEFSYLWPFTNAAAGTDYLAGMSGATQYLPDV